jgi:para-nitrobenzyl esterase
MQKNSFNGFGAASHLSRLALALLVGTALAGVCRAGQFEPTVVRLDTGKLQGVVDDGVVTYKGIPFAAAPTGELRWRPPQPAANWKGLRKATEFGADCMQTRFGPPPGSATSRLASEVRPPSEDCLFLNVWRPAGARPGAKLPVMFWIHGGGFVFGSGALPDTSGTQFAKHGVVLVAANYRLGRFGFFAFPSLSGEHPEELKGNYAYMDQIAALQWVKRNIAALGGDPGNITIFGFSAGGVSVHSLLTSPLAQGLFQKAIIESGGSRDSVLTARPMRTDGIDPNYPVSAETIGINFARSMGIEGVDQPALARLRSLTSDELLHGAMGQPAAVEVSYETTPVLDGRLITETAETAYKANRQPHVAVMLGSNSGDTAGNRIKATSKEQLFARFGERSAEARAAYDPDGSTDLATLVARANDDFGQAEPARFAASAFAKGGSPVYLYRFSYVQSAVRDRLPATPHGGEIGFVFGTLGVASFGPPIPPTPQDLEASHVTQQYWVNFAKTGNPNGAGLPTWPRYDPGKDMIFGFNADGTASAGPDPRKSRLDVTRLATESGKRADP